MKAPRCNVDSICVSAEFLEAIFIHSKDNYIIQTVKSRNVFEPRIWSQTFNKPLTKNIVEAKIIFSYFGLTLPLKTFSSSPLSQTLELAGLNGYNDKSRLLVQTLHELKSKLLFTRVTRVDIAIDYEGNIPHSIIKALSKHREPFKWKNTTYWKTAKEKKTNSYMDIKIYDKAVHANLDFPLMRLEFVFKGKYFNKLLLKDLETAYKKMEKSVNKATGLNVKITHILDPKK